MVTATGDTGHQGHRQRLRAWLDEPRIRNAILSVIIFNAITLGLSTSHTVMGAMGPVINMLDRIALAIFIVELTLKFYANGLAFFRSGWNIFDFVVVSLGLLPQTGALRALRALRVIRSLRILSVVPQMRAVVQALFEALPGMGAVMVMLGIVYYVFGVMATLMFGEKFDEWFGTLGRSCYSLFQIMTLESWSMGIVRPVMREYPYAWSFFVPFIIITSFSVLNLFIGILVNTMQSAVEEQTSEDIEELRKITVDQTEVLTAEIRALKRDIEELGRRSNG
jgi:voltage-gated sodium channel